MRRRWVAGVERASLWKGKSPGNGRTVRGVEPVGDEPREGMLAHHRVLLRTLVEVIGTGLRRS